jgi:hypothetical protein
MWWYAFGRVLNVLAKESINLYIKDRIACLGHKSRFALLYYAAFTYLNPSGAENYAAVFRATTHFAFWLLSG